MTPTESHVSISSMPNRFMALHRNGKNDNNSPHFSDFLKLKMTIRISHKCKHVEVPNLVYFGSPSTVLSKTNRTIFTYDKVLSIFRIWKVTPIFALKWSIFCRKSKFRILVCLVLWRNHRGTLSVNFTKID